MSRRDLLARPPAELPDTGEFVRSTERFRRELLAHCYHMLGSVDDAEDLVQETYLRAWRFYDGFEGRSSVRAWLYRIATNVCLTALENQERRMLPSGLGGPAEDPAAPVVPAGPEVRWLQPFPDAPLSRESADPAAIVASRESLRLALVASLQYLPGRQRAVLILRDVLAWSAAEVADLLGTTVAGVKSTLRRARARLAEVAPAADDVDEPDEPHLRSLLDRYITAFENADTAGLQRLLSEDAALEATPTTTWFAGLSTCLPFLADQVLGAPGDWRMFPTRANGQPAAVAYRRGEDGVHHAYGVVVLTAGRAGITRIHSFGDPDLVSCFGFPPTAPGGPVPGAR
ncbi:MULTISPECIES: sigma-70 family RNA polymerase sigma factor [unclassified Saccharothrix]|uniref:sigma-70 family RNA polymerase sigma factor n=1 Tax=unclassified Saccharothrix TaxID=2593673 RepID=UPI00307E9017